MGSQCHIRIWVRSDRGRDALSGCREGAPLALSRGGGPSHSPLSPLPLSIPHFDVFFELQARDALEQYRRSLDAAQAARARVPRPQLVGGRGMDWVAVDAGAVVVHLLTERARRYYDLEALFG